jgi:hypothetical protein
MLAGIYTCRQNRRIGLSMHAELVAARKAVTHPLHIKSAADSPETSLSAKHVHSPNWTSLDSETDGSLIRIGRRGFQAWTTAP